MRAVQSTLKWLVYKCTGAPSVPELGRNGLVVATVYNMAYARMLVVKLGNFSNVVQESCVSQWWWVTTVSTKLALDTGMK